jgi:16S rRNA (guanine1207-N2)-methyltransferase
MSSSQTENLTHYFSRALSLQEEYSRPPIELKIADKVLSLSTASGVFSKDKLDEGSRILLETLINSKQHRVPHRICDLGCGWGAIGNFLAAQFPDSEISMCDVNNRAALLADHNARQNHLNNARAWCGDGLSAARAEYFDLVVCNPPIRAGNAVIAKLFDDAYRCLTPGGVLCVVIRTAQGAKSWQKRLTALFGNCETLAIESGYRILQSAK